MADADPQQQRGLALDIVKTLRKAGFQAYWAGGCVRDSLLGRVPKDYDVATNARPDEVRALFGRRRTLEVGAAFGVIIVVGKGAAGQVEVTTFRSDAAYSDGRHPDSVSFSTPQADAERRDFTINGLFFDPLEERPDKQVIDYVGGQADLAAGIIRAIGDPSARFQEDKLRLLRAVRFAATFNFTLEAGTRQAIEQLAHQVTSVSAERIAQEMRLMLVHPRRAEAVRLLDETGLLAAILPEAAALKSKASAWAETLDVLGRLRKPSFPLALAALLRDMGKADGEEGGQQLPQQRTGRAVAPAEEICRRWKLSNKETDRVVWLVRHRGMLRQARSIPWPKLQRLLITDGMGDLVELELAEAQDAAADTAAVEHCRRLLELPPNELNPPPLVTGDDLIAHGIPQGKHYKLLLEKIRDAQLEKRISTPQEALALARQLLEQ